jgi:iron complex transport system substrate-binding protein
VVLASVYWVIAGFIAKFILMYAWLVYPSTKGVKRMNKNIIYIIAILAVTGIIIGTYGYIVFEGAISDLNASISNLEGDLASAHSTVEEQETTIDTIEGQLDTTEDQLSIYHSAILELEDELGVYNSNMSALNLQIEEQQSQIEEQQSQIDEYQEELSEYKEVTLVDRWGNVVTLTEPPERIVSLAPSNTEILFAVGAGDSVVGVTDYCNYPYDFAEWITAGNMTSIGSYWQPSTEPIVALDPDLVLATSASLDAATSLKNMGYAVLIIEGTTIDEVMQDILMVGRATYNNAEASALVIEMRARIDAVTTQLMTATTTPKVYHEVWNDPLMSVGPGTFIDELMTLAGGTNIFHDATTSWPVISSEAVIEKNPDVMFFPDMYMGVGNFYETIETVETRSGWGSITAVQNGALYEINADIISRSGPRLVDALEEIAMMVHPEIFGEP